MPLASLWQLGAKWIFLPNVDETQDAPPDFPGAHNLLLGVTAKNAH